MIFDTIINIIYNHPNYDGCAQLRSDNWYEFYIGNSIVNFIDVHRDLINIEWTHVTNGIHDNLKFSYSDPGFLDKLKFILDNINSTMLYGIA